MSLDFAYFAEQCREHAEREEWSDLCSTIGTSGDYLHFLFEIYWDIIPDAYKYDHVVACMTHRGDSSPFIRKCLRQARRYGKPSLPPEIADKDIITVYRGGREPLSKARYRISWSTDIEVAKWFRNRELLRGASGSDVRLYRGKISQDKVIAYTNDREEHEIMQYRSVCDVEDITDEIY